MTNDDEISFYYSGFKECLANGDLARACGYMHMIYTRISFHPTILAQITFEPLRQREFVRLLDMYVREFPDDPVGYLIKMGYHREKGRLDIIRKVWSDNCANAVKGFHYQPGVAASIFDAESGAAFTTLGNIGLGTKKREEIDTLRRTLLDGTIQTYDPSSAQSTEGEPSVETCVGEPIGEGGFALNGTLRGFNIPTRYYFRFGSDRGNLTEATEVRHMPAGLNGMVRDSGENIFHRINCFTSEQQFFEAPGASEYRGDGATQVPFPPVAVKLQWPFGKDRNHLDGVGVIDLFIGWSNQVQRRGIVDALNNR